MATALKPNTGKSHQLPKKEDLDKAQQWINNEGNMKVLKEHWKAGKNQEVWCNMILHSNTT